jgi:hypothetical protein
MGDRAVGAGAAGRPEDRRVVARPEEQPGDILMKSATVWRTRAAGLALLAVAGGIARAQGPNADIRETMLIPPRTGNSTVPGNAVFSKPRAQGALEKGYYSNWTFDAAEKKVVAFWSLVHKGDWFRYAWDGIKLVLDYPWGPPNPRFGAFDARGDGAELTIEMPAMCWKGWICNRAASEQWPADGLQYLNYARYPWLSGLAEDGPSIMKYRDPEQYRE